MEGMRKYELRYNRFAMPFKIETHKDRFLDKIYRESMTSLNKFYGINWKHHLPALIIVKDRKAIDSLRGEKTERWIVGWANGRNIFILNRNNMERESAHNEYTPEAYAALIKHELSHAFYEILSGGKNRPIWLCEGTAIFTSGQNRFKKRPDKFSKFLKFHDKGGADVYSESGFAITMLVDIYGKQKLLKLIKGTKDTRSKKEFERLFKGIYGFRPTYAEFNRMI
jgi:hypothetical protein